MLFKRKKTEAQEILKILRTLHVFWRKFQVINKYFDKFGILNELLNKISHSLQKFLSKNQKKHEVTKHFGKT